jgi:hypothetical protein
MIYARSRFVGLLVVAVLCLLGHHALAMNPVAPATIGYSDLPKVNSQTGLCAKRPTNGTAIYAAMTNQNAANKLRPVEILEHAATRLGYGLSPLGPLVPGKSNDCTSVFIAEELVRQVGLLGANEDNPAVLTVRRGLLPLTRFLRNDINQAIARFKTQDPTGESYNSLWWHAWQQVAGLMTYREMVGTQRQLQDGTIVDHQIALEEVLAEFWFNHFNVAASKPTQYVYGRDSYPEAIRFALGGTFASLLRAATRQPALIVYLDNQENIYDSATNSASNQNFARELLELHTFGVGPSEAPGDGRPYGQAEVEELAKILAGWHAQHHSVLLPQGASGFVYHPSLAANVPVRFLGTEYAPTGEARALAVLGMLADHAQTKTAICTKLSRIFYAPELVTGARDACIAAWGTGGDLKEIMLALLRRPEFWGRANYRKLYRTPIELVVSAMRGMAANLVDVAYAVNAEGRTEAPFTPANLTPSSYMTAINDLQASAAALFINGSNRRIENLMGAQRLNIAPPTGYANDGSRFLSTSYIDTASRTAMELAGLFEQLNAGSRRDLTSWQYTEPLIRSDIEARGSDFAMEKYLNERLAMGDVLPLTRSTNPAVSPFVLQPSHRTILSTVASTPATWAFWEAHPANKVMAKAWAGVALGNAPQLRK